MFLTHLPPTQMAAVDGNAGVDASREKLARVFHEDGFVALDTKTYALTQEQLTAVKTAVLKRYEQYMAVVEKHGIDLENEANSERIPGFYVRKGGRIDMQLASMVTAPVPVDKELTTGVDTVDIKLLTTMETQWKTVVDAIFQLPVDETKTRDERDVSYRLEYIGCVLARPGDRDQNWHLDGVHRNLTRHEPADRINVFVPLVDINPDTGGTEMKRRSQFHDNGRRGTSFDDYAELESVTHYVAAGTPLVMDYRVWHRGKANGSDVIRPLLYFKYAYNEESVRLGNGVEERKRKRSGSAAEAGTTPQKKKKRVALISVSK